MIAGPHGIKASYWYCILLYLQGREREPSRLSTRINDVPVKSGAGVAVLVQVLSRLLLAWVKDATSEMSFFLNRDAKPFSSGKELYCRYPLAYRCICLADTATPKKCTSDSRRPRLDRLDRTIIMSMERGCCLSFVSIDTIDECNNSTLSGKVLSQSICSYCEND